MLSGKKDPSANLNEGENHIRTASKIAEKIGVSENTYRDRKLIVNEGTASEVADTDAWLFQCIL